MAIKPVWPFTPQPNKWGYPNNPRWTNTPLAPINYDGRESEEPQVWTLNVQSPRSANGSKQHIPCGHWHKVVVPGEGGITGNIYYVWSGQNIIYENQQVWTALSDIDGTGWAAFSRTSTAFDKQFIQFQVVGTKIYYVWREHDGLTYQLWTGVMEIDGTNWVATKRTNVTTTVHEPQLQVVDTKIYYFWHEYASGLDHLWTAEMNTDGTGWVATERSVIGSQRYIGGFQVVDTKIYYVYSEYDGSTWQIWTAEMNTDGTGWTATKRTTSSYLKEIARLQVVGSTIYYVWREKDDDTVFQIWTGSMGIDGSGWTATKRTNSLDKYTPEFQVMEDEGKIYYCWSGRVGSEYQLFTAETAIDGTGWVETQRTNITDSLYGPQFQVVGDTVYFVWNQYEYNDDLGEVFYQIWTASMGTDGSNFTETQRTSDTTENWYPQLQIVID